ncbi:SDR family oxidoreductase [Flavobacterium alkalisoli]|uniref:SDR family oxidoreductase n=1 Tax=Flavobacterium alkalisoli TaxID=2602769 RepID=A0A5B9FUI2_9FLAO|nr:SDR family oxidoreductase [Flavobacterium alkalisoli]QEE50983.1 SDR family oxidoreductase [Flavobacterium alkalisoli]
MDSNNSTSRRKFLALAATAAAIPVANAIGFEYSQPSQSQLGAGRVAIVTGSSRGIGAATARRLALDGYAVTVNYLTNKDMASRIVEDIKAAGGRAIFRQADVADPKAVKALFDATMEAFGGVDVVVSNAGIMNTGLFAEMADDAFDRMIATNIKGSFNVLREASRRTRDGGRIISLSSSIIQMKPAGAGAYAASKAAQEMYAGVLAKELSGRRISVNAIAPGAVDTDLLRSKGTTEQLQGAAAMTPYGRLGKPEDIANIISLLCSEKGEWVNGQLIYANGGIV